MKSVKRYSDLSVLESMRREMDHFFDDLAPFSWKRGNGGKEIWAPNSDMSETENEYLVKIDLPGLSKDDIEVNYKDHRLTIAGERKLEKEEDEKNMIRKERYFGTFVRAYTLPEAIKEDRIKATFKDGVLTIEVPKTEVKKPTKIQID
ncbi:Hsp20/alpha crystallin family protein [Fodinibius halophilus]|uniref:Hsp20/alpha crystallin family protein n=1 Tax=Fodinibius halophilus TaxID=1736908 RepID=A0A6M1TCX4_9BACT|nr:Hsp20/alpha crystallin family protein [Fodinibius halophilus]NGP89861.1 Hsp20/alpha crystallin family protein [Fodinibius halophilus]